MKLISKQKKYVFIFLLILVILFLVWSKLFLISIGLLIVSDLLSTGLISSFLKSKLSKNVYAIIKYCSLFTLSICFAVFIRTFLFDIYYVPSISMERTLYPNDYVIVNKFRYGVKLPNHPRDIPVIGGLFKDDTMKHHNDLYTPLKAFKKLSREEVIVFKSTETNTMFLVKRIIGLPGDTIQINNTDVYINNIKLLEKDEYCYNYIDKNKESFYDIQILSNSEYYELNPEEKSKLNKDIKYLKTSINEYSIFPFSKQNEWTRDNYGPLIIPEKGKKIIISFENYDIYKKILKNYEKTSFKLAKGEQKSYTFKNNYYFMMGDNRHNSIDSRSFGFVPESYIQGKVITKF